MANTLSGIVSCLGGDETIGKNSVELKLGGADFEGSSEVLAVWE